jgi:hypothetical protein
MMMIFEHVELDISPIKFQLSYDIASKIFKFFFPESKTGKLNNKNELKRSLSRTPSSEKLSVKSDLNMELERKSTFDLSQMGIEGDIEGGKSESKVKFVFVKLPASEHMISYKGAKNNSVVDFENFILKLHDFEYTNKIWTWKEFFTQIKKGKLKQFLLF